MGNQVSAEEAEHVGYRVLGVQTSSPASSCGLVSFFDFVVAVDGVELSVLDDTFIEKIKAFEDRPLSCAIFNIKSRTTREVVITPTRNWGGQGMLGVTIRFDTYYKADEQLVRVLEVEHGSPAHVAGLTASTDYILGTAEHAFKDSDALTEACGRHLNKRLEVYVYNVDTDEVRVATIVPTRDWGGHGALGAAVAHGYLHRLPARCRGSNGVSVVDPDRPVYPRARDAMAPLSSTGLLPHPPGVAVASPSPDSSNGTAPQPDAPPADAGSSSSDSAPVPDAAPQPPPPPPSEPPPQAAP